MLLSSRSIIPLYIIVASIVVLTDWTRLADTANLTRENGSVETMSMVGYLAALAVYLLRSGKQTFWPVPVVLGLMALREFDADKRFTSEGLLSTNIFSADTLLWEKGLAVGLWALLVCTLFTLIRYRAAPFAAALRTGSRWAILLLAAIGIAAFSKSIDGLARKLSPLNIDVSDQVSAGAGTLEEMLELLIPVLFMLAMTRKKDRQDARVSDDAMQPAE
ncbi:hypothetical protein PARPLA_00525 [Rhodobacteraceae bacterium THAF1]|uniref:hypothetical protein n=1 Tax=Palleronia sp. THAF1 TaxID=2587842 RepID=UPI000F40D339|nr:hypothetical protein [Palleronia sp. THAF1]QFU09912.1 hypothetical protein FIU81_14635 [Palleronia sp. THAF1]VDC17185.1 hypothetical protein PARPLA_00525 [Rhodobacteraceae bacterium THAF1]